MKRITAMFMSVLMVCIILTACSVQVSNQKIQIVDSTKIKLGKSEKIDIINQPENVADTDITWTSSDERVATIDSEGTITGIGKGECVVTAEANGVKDECTVTVIENGFEIKTSSFSYESYDYDNYDTASFVEATLEDGKLTCEFKIQMNADYTIFNAVAAPEPVFDEHALEAVLYDEHGKEVVSSRDLNNGEETSVKLTFTIPENSDWAENPEEIYILFNNGKGLERAEGRENSPSLSYTLRSIIWTRTF